MFRPRVIPVLLISRNGLVKSRRFKDHKYIGDPLNAVAIFNRLRADELIFLDIDASAEGRLISLELVKSIGEEARVPFAVGGGIRSIDDIQSIIASGAEKVVLGSYAVEDPDFVQRAVDRFGSSTIVVCIDVKSSLIRGRRVVYRNASRVSKYYPVEFAALMTEKGAGEIIIQSVDQDGKMNGYDNALIDDVARSVPIPVVALGGAGSLHHLAEGVGLGHASAVASGSLFVFQSTKRGVLINYPDRQELKRTLISRS